MLNNQTEMAHVRMKTFFKKKLDGFCTGRPGVRGLCDHVAAITRRAEADVTPLFFFVLTGEKSEANRAESAGVGSSFFFFRKRTGGVGTAAASLDRKSVV